MAMAHLDPTDLWLVSLREHRRSQHEARGGNCLLLNFQTDNDFASFFEQENDPNFNQSPQASFRSPKMYYQISPTTMQNSKISPGVKPRTFVLGEDKVYLFIYLFQVLLHKLFTTIQ